MTSAELLARLRTMLDEASAGFWTDVEAYAALSDGQLQLCELAVGVLKAKKEASENGDVKIPECLKALLTTEMSVILTSGTASITLSHEALELISVLYTKDNSQSDSVPCYIRKASYGDVFISRNVFGTANANSEYFVSFQPPSTVVLETPVSGSYGSHTSAYIKVPGDISATVDPALPSRTMEPIVQFAFARMLAKDQRLEESVNAFKNFLQLSQSVVME